MTTEKNIKNRMNEAMSSNGRTFVWNPRSKFQVRRKIRNVRLTFGNNVELTFKTPLIDRSKNVFTSRLFTIKPTLECLETFSIVD